VHPRQISFTAARRAVISSTRQGAAIASLPAQMIIARRERILAALARRRVQTDRHRHRDRKTKARHDHVPDTDHAEPNGTGAGSLARCD
jgi:hypothetical protein